jgi:dihydroorotase
MPARYAVFKPGATVLSGSDLLGPVGLLPRARPEQVHAIQQALQQGLADGALAVGCGLEYTPQADAAESEMLFRTAATARVPIMVHARASGLAAATEAIDAARRAGTALHLFHLGSSGLGDLPEILELIDRHRATGMALTTEIYPYIAASSLIEGAMFNDGWQKRLRIDYPDLVWAATGERLTKESFDRYRPQGGRLIVYSMREENIQRAIAHPAVIVASDGVALSNGRGHPRGAGTFARVLGHYGREQRLLPLMEALAKMTILPARRLDHVSAMRNKGRIAVGADADLTVFDPSTVIDRATFEQPTLPSAGIHHVIVNGTFVVRDGDLVGRSLPGRPVRR